MRILQDAERDSVGKTQPLDCRCSCLLHPFRCSRYTYLSIEARLVYCADSKIKEMGLAVGCSRGQLYPRTHHGVSARTPVYRVFLPPPISATLIILGTDFFIFLFLFLFFPCTAAASTPCLATGRPTDRPTELAGLSVSGPRRSGPGIEDRWSFLWGFQSIRGSKSLFLLFVFGAIYLLAS